MMIETSSEENHEDLAFPTVWQLLTEEEQTEFWKYAGQHARGLSHRTNVFRQLCVAFKEAESGRSGSRSSKVLFGAVRPLSSDELRLGVSRLKGRLLDQPKAQPFLVGAFCNWIQDSRRAALNAVLDAMKCAHDERGSLKGLVPPFSPEVATNAIGALVEVHSAHTLALVCGGLRLNGKQWSGLAEIFEALQRIEPSSADDIPVALPDPIEQSQPEEAETIEPLECKPVTQEAVVAIRAGLDLLGRYLAAASTEASACRIPDLGAAIECWNSLCRQHAEAARALGVSSQSVADLEAAISHQSEVARTLADLTRCRALVHVTDPSFSGCAVIREKCDALGRIAESGLALDPSSIRAVAALLLLAENGDGLDDEQATHLRIEVEEFFGKSVATAALRGKLVVEESLRAPGEEENRSAAIADEAPRQADEQEMEAPLPPPPLVQHSLNLPDAELEPAAILAPRAQPADVSEVAIEEGPAAAGHIQVGAEEPSAVLPIEIGSNDEVAVNEAPYAESSGSRLHGQGEPKSELVEFTPSPDYVSFTAFCSTHWVDTSGSVGRAPWKTESFVPALAKSAVEAWDSGHQAIAYLFARGVVIAGGNDPLGIDDLASADQLLTHPTSHSSGVDTRRIERLRSCIASPSACNTPNIGLALMLEALRPTHPCSFTPQEIDILIDRAAFNDPAVNDVVRFLLQGWAAQLNPLSSLRARLLDAPEESAEVVEEALRSAQDILRTQIAALWSAAGGKIQRTHCRAAWSKFVQSEVVPLRDELAPSDPRASTRIKWTPERIRERVISLGRSFQRIMDAAEVKHQDRSVAEGAARQIVEALVAVSDALQRLIAQRQRSHLRSDGLPHEAGQRLLSASSSNGAHRLNAALFAAVLHNAPQANMLRLKAGYLINHVDAIRYLDPNALSQEGISSNGLCILDFENPTAVSALLQGWRSQSPPTFSDDGDLWVSLRNVAADRERRDILAALSSTEVLQAHERTLLHRYALELGDQAFEATRDLERLWGASNELMASSEAQLKGVVEESKTLTAIASSSMTRSLLLLEWLKQSVALATTNRDAAATALLDLAAEKPDNIASRVANYFEVGDYRAGVALFHSGTVPFTDGDRLGSRRTMWRADALKTWGEPRTKLANDLRGATPEQNRLVDLWTAANLEPSQREAMPKQFYAVISGEAGRSPSENQKRFPVKLADLREHKERKTTISCETIRNYFKGSKLNPSFIPQLAVFSQIVIAPSPQQAGRGASVLDDWCKVAGNEAPSSLFVFLAPGLPLARRDELCSGFRKRGVAAAIIDDFDLCRLCAATHRLDGHDFVPFLEVLLEQLDLDTASPFSSLDGQHVRLETYIGRRHEAERIALGWSYTRVFSGRKLGKSALLKYVANTYDGYPLPSGNTLNVFFITIAGGESERWVVDCIIDEMSNRFGLAEKSGQKDQAPAERFSAYMKRFLQEKPRLSVLLILDEADAFVEGQLSRYDHDREGSLSFRMMKELPAQVDSSQLPRVRTIFSGYRVTNTRGGVWANAGDVLVLRPLAEEEAVQFLEGMLARIGIALGNHAPFVAMRCGFQPAVLIRFGESLVRRLKRSNRSADRETLTVSHEEVLATLGEQGVLDEIKTVVNNNFQGNRIGAVIFGATLLALKDLEPGLALTEGPAQVLAKLREIDPNSDWLERVDTSPLSEIERNLQDFIDRELLTVSDAPRFGVREYRLRFPHFLPVLTQQSEVALEVRQQIQAIRGGATQRRVSQCVLSESALDTIRYWFHQKDSNDCKLIVVGGHWIDSLLDPKCGLPDRLGCERTALSLPKGSDEAVAQIKAGVQVFGKVASDLWNTFLDTAAGQPLVMIGGLDLQRTARRYALDGGQVPVEVITLGRLTEGTLTWWFEDARALHFKSGSSIGKIARATGLVPFLVGAFDKLLQQGPGSEVSERELDAALDILDERMSEYAAQLSDPAWGGRLSPREIELLKMAVQVTEEVSDSFDLEKDFNEYWSLLDVQGSAGAPFSNPEDWSALKLLSEAGLLSTRAEVVQASTAQSLGRVSFDRSDTLVRLIKLLGPNRVA